MKINPKDVRILIVDDEPEVHAVLDKMLGSVGYNVSAAYSAEEAFGHIRKTKPDVILLDLMMPVISGIEVCNRVKENPETRDIIVLIVSARDEQEDRIEGLAHGADDYISKPFHLKALIRKIEHMLEKREEQRFNEMVHPT